MKIKRLLATFLCLAMIMTSGQFSTTVYGEEIVPESVIDDENVVLEENVEDITEESMTYEEIEEVPGDTQPLEGEISLIEDEEVSEDIDADSEEINIDSEDISEQPDEVSIQIEEFEDDIQLNAASKPSEAFIQSGGVLQLVDENKLTETVTLPSGTTCIPSGIFNVEPAKSKVKAVYFIEPAAFEEFGEGAFEGSSVISISLGENCSEIPKDTFKGSSIKDIKLNCVEQIGESAFENCRQLMTINLQDIVNIDKYAFKGCTMLNSVSTETDKKWGSYLTRIGESAFESCGLTSVNLTGNGDCTDELVIEKAAFSGNTNLTSVNMPARFADIPDNMFEGCSSLIQYLDPIDSSTTKIGDYAFRNCEKLERVSFRTNLKEIGKEAFAGCFIYVKTKTNKATFYEPNGDVNIAEDAFPATAGDYSVTLCGYDGKIQEYANSRGCGFESLNSLYTLKASAGIKNGSVSVNVKDSKAKAGEIVYITVTPKDGYSLMAGKLAIRYGSDDGWNTPKIAPELYSATNTSQVFRFEMPKSDVVICSDDDTIEKSNNIFCKVSELVKGEFVVGVQSEFYKASERKLDFPNTGYTAQLSLSDKRQSESFPIGIWSVSIKSTAPDVVSVSPMGKITALKRGNATVSISVVGTSKKYSINVSVDKTMKINTLTFEKYMQGQKEKLESGKKCDFDNVSYIYGPHDDYNDSDYYLLEYTKETIAKASQDLFPRLDAYKEMPDEVAYDACRSLVVNSVWTTSDKTVASITNSASYDNSNKITIKKGIIGETFILATVTNEDGTKVSDGFIIRVLDPAPRIVDDSLVLNCACTEGTIINTSEVYGYEVIAGTLKVCVYNKDKGVYQEDGGVHFNVSMDDDKNIYLIPNQKALGIKEDQKKDFAKNTYYIKGDVRKRILGTPDDAPEYVEGSKTTFYMSLPKITVKNKRPKLKLQTKGTINTFYNNKKVDKDGNPDNFIIVSHGVENVMFDWDREDLDPDEGGGPCVEFISEANYKNPGSEPEDTFAYNFDIEPLANNSGFMVSISDNIDKESDYKMVPGKTNTKVMSGYVRIWFKGYSDPFVAKFSVPHKNTPPKYVLSMPTAKASIAFFNPEFKVQILDDKKEVVDLEGAELGFNYNYTKLDVFDDGALDDNVDEDFITFQLNGQPRNATAGLTVRKEDWAKDLLLIFNVKKASVPQVTLKPSKVSLNSATPSQSASMVMSCNIPFVKITDIENITYTGSKKNQAIVDAAEKMIESDYFDVEVDTEKKVSYLKCYIDSDIPSGTYSFSATPIVEHESSGDTSSAAKISFKIVVTNKKPGLKLSSNIFTLNALYANVNMINTYNVSSGEYSLVKTSVTGVPKDSKYSINVDEATFEKCKTTNPEAGDLFTLEAFNPTNPDDGVPSLKVKLNPGKYNSSFKYDYYVDDVKVRLDGESEAVKIPRFKIRISGVYAEPTIKIKKSGKLNQVDPTSAIVNKITVANINGTLIEPKIIEYDRRKNNSTYYGYPDLNAGYSYHFVAEMDEELDNVINITLNQEHILDLDSATPDPLVDNATYSLSLRYKLKETGDKVHEYETRIKIVPKQELPKIKMIDNDGVIVNGKIASDRTITFFVAQTSVGDALLDDTSINVDGVRIHPSASDNMKRAYKVVSVSNINPYTNERWWQTDSNGQYVLDKKKNKIPGSYVTVQLVQPSAIAFTKNYLVPLEIRFVNQNRQTSGIKRNVEVFAVK